MASLTTPTWTLTDRLRKAREAADLKQDDLAVILGVSRSTIGKWESGSPIKRGQLAAWAMATGVPFEWLETGDEIDLTDPETPRTLGRPRNAWDTAEDESSPNRRGRLLHLPFISADDLYDDLYQEVGSAA